MRCPCGSEIEYALCCGLWHGGGGVPTAEALMRARYVAFVLGEIDYLVDTTHPSVRRSGLRAGYQTTCEATQWLGLEVLEVSQGGVSDKVGKVVFRATYREAGRVGVHWERSRFKRYHAAWHYFDGVLEGRSET